MSLVTHAQERYSGQPESATCTPVPYFREVPATAGPGNQLAVPSSSPLKWHTMKEGIKRLGSRGHRSAPQSFCPFLSIPRLPSFRLPSVSLIQFLSAPPSWEGIYSCPPQTLLRQKDERSHPHPKHSPWLPSPQYLAPAPSSRLWLASVSRPAGWPRGQARAEDWPPPSFRPQPLPRQRCAAVM